MRYAADTGGQPGAYGKRIVNTVPAALEDSTDIAPPWAITISRTGDDFMHSLERRVAEPTLVAVVELLVPQRRRCHACGQTDRSLSAIAQTQVQD